MKRNEILETLRDLLEDAQNLQSSLECLTCDIPDNLYPVDIDLAESDIEDCITNIESAIDDLESSRFDYATSYKNATDHIQNMVLCNQVHELYNLDNLQGDVDNIGEVFQWFITDCSDDDVQFLVENYERMFFFWCAELEHWILAVDHFGTSWDYVSIGTNNEFDKED